MFLLNHPKVFGSSTEVLLSLNAKNKLEVVKDTARQYVSCRYYENNNGKFEDKTFRAGLGTYAFGLSAIIEDFNNDSYPDIYVANDYREPDYLFINNKNGTFTEKAKDFFKHFSSLSMGSDYADINNDGYPDLMVLDMLPPELTRQKTLKGPDNYDLVYKKAEHGFGFQHVKNVLQLNNGNNTFSDISYLAGVAFTDWSWAPLIADFDNDGFKDMYITKGFIRDITDMDFQKFGADSMQKRILKTNDPSKVMQFMDAIPKHKTPNYYFKNNRNLSFTNVTSTSGLAIDSWTNGGAYADLDNDGDLDLVMNNLFDPAFIFRNNTIENKQGNFIKVQLKGSDGNQEGIGAQIEIITNDGKHQWQCFNPYKGFLSTNDRTIHFGVGANTSATVNIQWPNRLQQTLDAVGVNRTVVADIKNASMLVTEKVFSKEIFTDITKNINLNFTHIESDYIDFKREPLIPHQFSKLGPCIEVADLNGDKLDDFFVGGARGQEGIVFIQNTDGSFKKSTNPCFVKDKELEDTGAKLADMDGDGDVDLVVVSGSNEVVNDLTKYPVRLYVNDGNANFTKQESFKDFNTSGKAIAIEDIDKDGDLDIFIGGKIVPGHYGLIPESLLLINEKGNFTNIANQIPNLQKVGMVSDAVWCDVNKDTYMDLVIVGEWMPITVFINNKGVINNNSIAVPNSNGWWNCVSAVDLDNDGSIDLVGGNLGLNSRYKGDIEHPVTMLVNDFDKNGSTDCVISVFQDGQSSKAFPIALRDNMLEQMPFLRKKYLRNKDYAYETVNEIFTSEQIKSASLLSANYMPSAAFINNGTGNFSANAFGARAQMAPVNAILSKDFNKDGKLDLLLAGNRFESDVETGKDDAGTGIFLKSVNGSKFQSVSLKESGFFANNNVKSMQFITIQNKPCILVGNNSGKIQVFSYALY
jgi:enediyne biosynthesis protein E4